MAQDKQQNPGGQNKGMQGMGGQGTTGQNPTNSTPGREGGGKIGAQNTGGQNTGATGGSDRTFRCADVGNSDCRWEVSGHNDQELMPKIEQHGREAHNIQQFDGETRSKVQNAIRDRQAA